MRDYLKLYAITNYLIEKFILFSSQNFACSWGYFHFETEMSYLLAIYKFNICGVYLNEAELRRGTA